MGTLYLVSTPIGNLEDISRRAVETLRRAKLVAAEDTRRTRILLDHYNLRPVLISYHEHNKLVRLDQVLKTLEEGDVALVSDAGTPGLSDPGYELVRAAWEAGHVVSPIPGPSAPMAALVASGLATDRFLYLGYFARRAADRRKQIRELVGIPWTIVAFEVPHRLRATLADLAASLGPDRRAAACRELTKMHEEIIRGTLTELLARFEESDPRGEFTLVIEGAGESGRWPEDEVRRAVGQGRKDGLSVSDVARQVAEVSGWPRGEVYRMALEAK